MEKQMKTSGDFPRFGLSRHPLRGDSSTELDVDLALKGRGFIRAVDAARSRRL